MVASRDFRVRGTAVPAGRSAVPRGLRGGTLNAFAADAAYAADPEKMKEEDPDLAYYIGHGDHNPDGSG